jgi:hypothetical protein
VKSSVHPTFFFLCSLFLETRLLCEPSVSQSFKLFLIATRVLIAIRNVDLLDSLFRLRPNEVNGEKTIREIGACHLHSIGKQEYALKLPGRYPAMEIAALLIVLLAATEDKLPFFDCNLKLVFGETGDSERYAQGFLLVACLGNALDIIGRIAVGWRAGDALQGTFDLVEA